MFPRRTVKIRTGTKIICPFIAPSPNVGEVGAATILFTTSIPWTTCPNTANPWLSPGFDASASNDVSAPTVMKKSPAALPGLPRAIEIAPSSWVSPVRLVGSWAIGGSSFLGKRPTPPCTSPASGASFSAR